MRKQYERTRLWLSLLVMVMVATVIGLSGCQGTRDAYRAADTLGAYAYVVGEHYAAVLKEAADISEHPGTPESVREKLRAADNKARPLVLALRPLVDAYELTKSAESEVQLQVALDRAVVALHQFIEVLKGVKS